MTTFTVSPNTAQAGIYTVLTLTGTSTAWVSGTTKFSGVGVAGFAVLNTFSVTATSATLYVYTGTATGTVVLSDSTDAATASLTTTAGIVQPANLHNDSPAVVVNTTGNVITLSGAGTSWSGSPFSVTGGTGASITAQTVNSATSASITLTAGSAVGPLTLSDGTHTLKILVLPTAFSVVTPTAVGPGSRSSMVTWCDANTLSGADDSSVSSWGLFSATGSAQPVISANGGPNGEKCVTFNNSSTMTVSGTNATLQTCLLAGSSYTLTFVFRTWGPEVNSLPALVNGTQNTLFNQGSTAGLDQAANIILLGGSSEGGFKRNQNGPINTLPILFSRRWNVVHYTYTTGSVQSGGTSATGIENIYLNGNLVGTKTGGTNNEKWTNTLAYTLVESANLFLSQFVVDNVALSQTAIYEDMAYWHGRWCTSNAIGEHVAFGDSRTAGVSTQRNNALTSADTGLYPFPTLLQQQVSKFFPVWYWFNAGVAGAEAAEGSINLLQYYMYYLNPLYNQVFTLLIGVNSYGASRTALTAYNDLITLSSLLLNNFARVVFLTEIDDGASMTWATWRYEYNQYLRAAFPNTVGSYYLVDTAANALIGILGQAESPAFTPVEFGPDGLHLISSYLANEGQPAGGNLVLATQAAPTVFSAIASLKGLSQAGPLGRVTSTNMGGGL